MFVVEFLFISNSFVSYIFFHIIEKSQSPFHFYFFFLLLSSSFFFLISLQACFEPISIEILKATGFLKIISRECGKITDPSEGRTHDP